MFSVVVMDAWPQSSWISLGWAPAATARATAVCRKSWIRSGSSPVASMAFFQKRLVKLLWRRRGDAFQ